MVKPPKERTGAVGDTKAIASPAFTLLIAAVSRRKQQLAKQLNANLPQSAM
jgi:hypothetical protein